MSDRRTPLGRALGDGSAKDGTGHWWTQRISSVALLLLGAWFLVSLTRLPGFDHANVQEWLGQPWTAVLMLLLVLTIARHSDLGLQVVIEDYVHQPFLKIAAIVLMHFLHILVAAVSIFAILRMAF
ncbi:MAG TPA: succinate dehydrogenase, hydrophobic membrane anchor protein [Woeseiaceae bacterium]|nr:succinate dehydrogenase, hydrophobic membrane anchor protein [Woeseiaceae bacterium]